MATTIITDTTPVTRTQHGIRLPDGREFWATGYLFLEDDQITVVNPYNNADNNGQLRQLTTGLFKDHNLADLVMDPAARAARTGADLPALKGKQQTAVKAYRDLMRAVARDTGIDAAEYEKGITILTRKVVLMVGPAVEHRVGMDDAPAEPTTEGDAA